MSTEANETTSGISELLGRLYSNLMSLETAMRVCLAHVRGDDRRVFFHSAVNDVVPAAHIAASPEMMTKVILEFEKDFTTELAQFPSVPHTLMWDRKDTRNLLFHAQLFRGFESGERSGPHR